MPRGWDGGSKKRKEWYVKMGVKTETYTNVRCAEHDCVWNYVHWKNGENYTNGCYMLSEGNCGGEEKMGVEEARQKRLI